MKTYTLKCQACDHLLNSMEAAYNHDCPGSWLFDNGVMFEVKEAPAPIIKTTAFSAGSAASPIPIAGKEWAKKVDEALARAKSDNKLLQGEIGRYEGVKIHTSPPLAPVPTRPSALGPLEVPDAKQKSIAELRAELRKMIGRR